MRFFQWLTFIEGSAKTPVSQAMQFRGAATDDPRRIAADQAAARPLGLIEVALTSHETIVPGLFTAADLQLTFLEEILEAGGQLADWPAMRAHLGRMRERPAYRRAEEKGGPVGLKQLFGGAA